MYFRLAFKTSFGHLQDVLARYLACLGKTSLRHLVDVFLPTGTFHIFFGVSNADFEHELFPVFYLHITEVF